GLLAGSRGSLAISQRIRLRLDRRPAHRRWLVLAADSFAAGLAGLGALAPHGPAMLALFDASTLAAGPGRALVDLFALPAAPAALLLAEFEGEDAARLAADVDRARVACATSALRPLRPSGPVAGVD